LIPSIYQIDVSFLCVCLVIDNEFRHNIVKAVAADYFDDVMTKFIVNNTTDALKTDIDLFFTITKLSNCALSLADASHEFEILSVHILTIKINQ